VLDEVARLLEPLGIQRTTLRYRLDASRLYAERAIVSSVLGETTFAALHPFAGSAVRCVPLGEWVKVADELVAEGTSVLWIGNPSELLKVKSLRDSRNAWHYSDALSNGSLATVAAAISHARIFIGHDSGPMHIAAALGVPTVGVFAPGEPVRTFPQGHGEWRIISRKAAADIAAEQILEEAEALLR
jgi:ADP-heptose:LPS heptosyltransferase